MSPLVNSVVRIPADRLSEAIKRIEDIEDELKAAQTSRGLLAQQARDLETRLAERLENASKRLEVLAKEMGPQR